ncbi:MAG: PP0621 family protein [Burkholderiales bacterium]
MGRIVILVVLVVIAVWAIRRAIARSADRERTAKPGHIGALVRCAHCGVYLPAAESRTADGLEYCSEEHARLGPGEDR